MRYAVKVALQIRIVHRFPSSREVLADGFQGTFGAVFRPKTVGALQEIGLEPERLEMYNLSSADGPRFAEIVTEMSERVARLGPSPIPKGPDGAEKEIQHKAHDEESVSQGGKR